MSNTDTNQPAGAILPQPPEQNVTIAETLPKALPAPPPKDEGELKLVKKVAAAFQKVVDWSESRDEAKFYVVVERTRGPIETIECATEQDLRACVRKLCAEVYVLRGNRENADIRITVFHGVRYYLQKWPFAALVHGKDVIPLDPLDDLEPFIDPSGSAGEQPNEE